MRKKIDSIFLGITLILTIFGFLIFTSASLGLLSGAKADLVTLVTSKQLLIGIVGGLIAAFFASKIKYIFWRKNAFYILLLTTALSLLIFVPGLGLEHNGAKRWLNIGPISFQPSEFLKYGYIIYLAAWFSKKSKHADDPKFGLIPFCVISGIVSILLILQPDTDTLAVMLISGLSIFFASGARWKDIFIIGLIGIIGLAGIVSMKPYIRNRIMTFIDPAGHPQTSGYQIQQSLIAIGSGGLTGKGFGQSVQKFGFLPEPVGDSIFAVAGEEFGFIGGVAIIILFLFFALRGLRISVRAPDEFGRLLGLGIVILITTQAFMNISAMLAIIPLSGQTLPLISHGGTALLVTLGAIGIVFNISKDQKKLS